MIGPALFLLAASISCGPPPAVDLVDSAPTVDVEVAWRASTDAHLPTDVHPVDGGAWVLDSYDRRLLSVGPDQPQRTLPASIGRSVRMAPATPDGVWLTDPEGQLLRIDASGQIAERLAIDVAAPPIAVAEQGGELAVALRDRTIAWIDRETSETGRIIRVDADHEPLGLITDLVRDGAGLLAVDSSGAKVHRLNELGAPTTWFGRFGLWSGALASPRSAAFGPDGVAVVVDPLLGVAQAFDVDGVALGVLAQDGEPLRFEHPLAIRAADPHTLLVLDAGNAEVVALTLTDAAVAEARTHRGERALRERLAEPAEAADAESCLLCHDGFTNDSRQVWDDDLHHHPVNVEPEHELPLFFPLKDGKLFCGTCHSPHGTSTAEEVESVQKYGDQAHLVRHDAADGDVFTRMTRQDSALCAACHGDAAHADAMDRLGFAGSAHPSGKALQTALAERPPELQVDVSGGCLGCHGPHGAIDEALTRSAGDGLMCLSCHTDRDASDRGHRLAAVLTAVDLPVSPTGELTCITCHEPLGGKGDALLQHPEAGLCTTCHQQQAAAARKPHGKLGDPSCIACHDVHEGPQSSHLLSRRGTVQDPGACLDCHAAGKRNARAGVAPGELGHPVGTAQHDGKSLTCETCHDAHAPSPATGDGLCTDCHEEQHAAQDAGGHGLVACHECHDAHREPAFAALANTNPNARRCLACHGPGGEAETIGTWDHPAPVFGPDGKRWKPVAGLPLFGPDGSVRPDGVNGDLSCSSCHWTHGPDPVKPGDNLRRAGWEAACSSCHGDNALALYRYFHQPERREGVEEKPR